MPEPHKILNMSSYSQNVTTLIDAVDYRKVDFILLSPSAAPNLFAVYINSQLLT